MLEALNQILLTQTFNLFSELKVVFLDDFALSYFYYIYKNKMQNYYTIGILNNFLGYF